MWSRLGMCGAYGIAMCEIAEDNEEIVACTADLTFFSGLDRFSKKFENRFFNVGIAEQNLVGVAGGLAKEKFNPFVSTYASFAVTRALDQVRTNMGYMKLPIKLIGLTSGFSVGILGVTHMSIEDIAIMRSIPNITIISPADTMEAIKVIWELANYNKPAYVRLTGPMNCPIIYDEDYKFEIGKAIKLVEGNDVAIVSCGTVVSNCIKAAELLKEHGVSATVVNMHTIKPLDKEMLNSLKAYKLIVTVEEHSVIGGLGSAVAEYVVGERGFPQIEIMGIEDCYSKAGDYEFLISKNKLDEKSIAERILNKLEEL